MRLSRKLVMVSAAALMAVSPVAAPVISSSVAQAATKSSSRVHNTYGKNSKVKPTKTQYAVNKNGKKTSKKIYKNGEYIIWNVKEINGKVYYSIQTDLKYWIPAVDTKGTVQYKSGSTTVTLTTDGKKVVQKEKSAKKSEKATKKTTSKKADTKSAKENEKTTKKTTSKKADTKSTKKSEKTTKKTASKKADTKSTKKSEKTTKKTTSKKADTKSTKKSEKATKKSTTKKADTKSTKKSEKTTKKTATKKTDTKSTKKSEKTAKKSTSKKAKSSKAIKVVKITATKKTPVVDKNGKQVKTYQGSKKYNVIGKGITVKGLGTKKINGKTYYALEPNKYYVLADNFKEAK